MGFPDSSVGKECACSAGDPGSIPGLGTSTGGIGYTVQYSWASLVAQLVKNLPTKKKKESAYNVGHLGSVPGLGRAPGEGKSYQFQYSGLENAMDYIVHRIAELDTTE